MGKRKGRKGWLEAWGEKVGMKNIRKGAAGAGRHIVP